MLPIMEAANSTSLSAFTIQGSVISNKTQNAEASQGLN